VDAAGMNQQPLEDVLVPSQMRATHAARVVDVRERTLDPLAALAHQAPSASSTYPAAIAIHRRLRLRLVRPIASAAVRLRDVCPNAHGVQVHHCLIAVIPLFAND